MDLVHLAVPILFVFWDSHNKPIYHRQSQSDAKMTSFRIAEAAIHKPFFAFRVVSRLIHVVINFLLFEPVQDYVNVCSHSYYSKLECIRRLLNDLTAIFIE